MTTKPASLGRRAFIAGGAALGAAAGCWRGALATPSGRARPERWIETPSLADAVTAGELPAVQDRVPAAPLVVDLTAIGRKPGVHGGVIRTLIRKKKNIRYMNVWGYARLVGYDRDLQLQPDLLLAVDSVGDRSFTLRLRPGHQWSDGRPFTTADFLYWWRDVANHPILSPSGPPSFMLVEGRPPAVDALDETTIRFAWHTSNPLFLPELAKARPPFIYRPAHYLKAFHQAHADPDTLARAVAEDDARNWAQLHNRRDNMYKNDNPDLPTLQPWLNTTRGKASRYVMARNPYFHRVDVAGRQLPYVDRVEMSPSGGGQIPVKARFGEVDLQAKGLAFDDVPALKRGEEEGGFQTRLWPTGYGSDLALYPNLTTKDPEWRALLRDVRFRRALSLGIDRELINETLYFGLGKPGANTVIARSEFFSDDLLRAYAGYDPERARRLLDEVGLTKRRGDGVRVTAAGTPMEIVVETFGERAEEVNALQLIAETWREIGVKLLSRPTDRDIVRHRAYAGMSIMTMGQGWDMGAPSQASSPGEYAPTRQDTLCWPAWGQHYQTKGGSGEAPDEPAATALLTQYRTWLESRNAETRRDAWRAILAIHAEQVFSIGVLCEAPQPVIVSDRLRNVPEAGLYAWDPGGHFGVHRMDEWWFADAEPAARVGDDA